MTAYTDFSSARDGRDEKLLAKMVAASVAVHLAIIGGIVVKRHLGIGEAHSISDKVMAARLVRLGTPPRRLKHREMPRKLPKLPAKRNRAHLQGAKAGPSQKGYKGGTRDYTKEMQAALDRIRAQVAEEEQAKDLPADLPPTPGSPDGVPEGDVIDPSAANKINTYVARVGFELRTKGGWHIPTVIPKEEASRLSATVLIMLDSTGRILKRELVSSSGNNLFDNAAMATVARVPKVSPPPADLPEAVKREILDEGLEVEFTGTTYR